MVDVAKEKLQPELERQRVGEELPTVESVRQAQDKSPRKSENIEVMSWMEKLERRFGRTQPQATGDVQDDTSKPFDQAQGKQPPVTVPVTATQMQAGAKLPIDFSLSWLVIWAKRRIQQLLKQNRKVLFSPSPEATELRGAPEEKSN